MSHSQFLGKKAVIIGLGRMGQAHIEAALQLGIRIIGTCDISQEKLIETQEKWQLKNVNLCQRAEDLFSLSEKPDLAIISTTADSHCSISMLAVEAKISKILCEKPMARSLQECDQIINACQSANVEFAVNHQMRFIPQFTQPKSEILSGKLGDISSMNVVGGNFGIAMNGSHYIEAFHYLTESKPIMVAAWFGKERLSNPRGPAFSDESGQLRIISETGKRFFLEVGDDQGHGMTTTYATSFGHIFVDELEGEMICVGRKSEFQHLPKTRYGSPWDRWIKRFQPYDNVQATKTVLVALLSDNNYPNMSTGRMVVNTLAAAYHSNNNNGKMIELTDPSIPYDETFAWA